jgi:arylsulfatase
MMDLLKPTRKRALLRSLFCWSTVVLSFISFMGTTFAQEIVHDAEFYVLKAQHGDKWAAQDKELDKKLAALKAKHGTTPNIIHIMWDDTAVGEIGIPHLQKNRGFETPNMNKMAADGAYFTRMYTEPSCTPSRAAALTGRHAVRNGMYTVSFPYEYGGLAEEEVTIAEVLSQAGYATAFYGKYHLGDVPESYATNQGFDEALWTPYNQVPSLYMEQIERAGVIFPTTMYPEIWPNDPYDMDKGFRTKGYVWALEGKKGGDVTEFLDTSDLKNYLQIDAEGEKRTLAFAKKNAAAKKPFYVAYWPQLGPFTGFPEKKTLGGALLQEGLVRVDSFVGTLLDELKAQGIAENTLVILMADNGPMTHNGPPGMVEHLYRGGKGDYTEGGVRVAALASWPGVIEPGTIIGDIIHETDLFTTFARLGEATQYIPTDRIIDGIDQTAVFLEGDTHSRRDYVFIYTGNVHAATVKGRFKRKWVGELPGLSGAAFFDLYNDPREVRPEMLPGFPLKGMFMAMKTRHEIWKEKYPDKLQAHGMPFVGLKNARPEVVEASKHRFSKDDVPFDIEEVLERRGGNTTDFDTNWGAP